MENHARSFAAKWRDACNSHNLEEIVALYGEGVVFKSPRVRTVSGDQTGIIRGKDAVCDYWRKILEKRPDLAFEIGEIFAGVDSVAIEYRVGELRGIEFMTLDDDGLISFASGNDVV